MFTIAHILKIVIYKNRSIVRLNINDTDKVLCFILLYNTTKSFAIASRYDSLTCEEDLLRDPVDDEQVTIRRLGRLNIKMCLRDVPRK